MCAEFTFSRVTIEATPLDQLRQIVTLAVEVAETGRCERVLSLTRRALRLARLTLGGDEPDDSIKAANHADACWVQNRFADAQSSYCRAVNLARAQYGPRHLRTLVLKLGWAALWIDMRQLNEARDLLAVVHDDLLDRCGVDHPLVTLAAVLGRVSETLPAPRVLQPAA